MATSSRKRAKARLRILVVDVGGTHVKLLASGQRTPRRFDSGPTLTPRRLVAGVKRTAKGWAYDAVSIGYPGMVVRGRPISEPHNLGRGWVGFDYAKALGRPVRILNDAAMQALGSYRGGKMLFLGLGTGLGTAMVVDGVIEPMEIAHLPYRKGTYEDYIGARGLQRRGQKKWQRHVTDVVERLAAALEPDEVVLGGGNTAKLDKLPPGCRLGSNANAFLGGYRLWSAAGGGRGR
jgi:polyphosphate glucokinase